MSDEQEKLYDLQFSSVQFSSVQFSSVQFSSVQFSSVQFSSVQFSSVQFSSVACVHIGQEIEEINGTYQSVLPIRSGLISPISSSLSESMEHVSTSDPSWLPYCRLPVGAGSRHVRAHLIWLNIHCTYVDFIIFGTVLIP